MKRCSCIYTYNRGHRVEKCLYIYIYIYIYIQPSIYSYYINIGHSVKSAYRSVYVYKGERLCVCGGRA